MQMSGKHTIRKFGRRSHAEALLAILVVMTMCAAQLARAQELTVSAQVVLLRPGKAGGASIGNADAVVWLRPLDTSGKSLNMPAAAGLRKKIVQKDKRFTPHVLPVMVGSVVDFPNLDPFFHNVFSLYDGKRFDLGLYESGKSARVKFDRSGICYVFCNIHPEMSAVVIALETPYSGVSDEYGRVNISGVPPGRYLLSVWHPLLADQQVEGFPREVQVSPQNTSLGNISIRTAGSFPLPHKNKHGQEYESGAPLGGLTY